MISRFTAKSVVVVMSSVPDVFLQAPGLPFTGEKEIPSSVELRNLQVDALPGEDSAKTTRRMKHRSCSDLGGTWHVMSNVSIPCDVRAKRVLVASRMPAGGAAAAETVNRRVKITMKLFRMSPFGRNVGRELLNPCGAAECTLEKCSWLQRHWEECRNG
jgi:hypothetical protein